MYDVWLRLYRGYVNLRKPEGCSVSTFFGRGVMFHLFQMMKVRQNCVDAYRADVECAIFNSSHMRTRSCEGRGLWKDSIRIRQVFRVVESFLKRLCSVEGQDERGFWMHCIWGMG